MATIPYLLQKEFIQIRRNKSMLPIIFVLPLVQLLILAFAATFEIKETRLHIIDRDHSSMSRLLISKFSATDYYQINDISDQWESAGESLLLGDADQVLIIPRGFEREFYRDNEARLQIINDAINGSAAGLRNTYALSIINSFYSEVLGELNGGKKISSPVKLEYSFWFNPEMNYKNYMVPGILVLLVTIIGLFLSSMNIVREKEMGTIEQINVTPIRKYQFIIGKLVPFLIIGLLELAFGLTLAWLVFRIPIEGSLLLIFGVACVYLCVVLGLGLLISTAVDTQQQSMFISWFFMIIFILMSGLFTPVEGMPEWTQKINHVNPIAYFIEIIRMIMLKGSGLMDISRQVLSLAIYALLALSAAIWRYRKVAV